MPFARPARSSVAVAAQLWPVARDTVSAISSSLQQRALGADELDEARELLAYWERRARRLPRWSMMRRREARTMARVWRERVADRERLLYGAGLVGAVALYAAERRMPTRVAHRGRQTARVAAWTVVSTAIAVLVVVAAIAVAVAVSIVGML